jgi:hypothetical protein
LLKYRLLNENEKFAAKERLYTEMLPNPLHYYRRIILVSYAVNSVKSRCALRAGAKRAGQRLADRLDSITVAFKRGQVLSALRIDPSWLNGARG